MSMFCYQCEQTAKGTGCTVAGVCGKQPDVATLQDLLVYAVKGIGYWADLSRAVGGKDEEIDRFVIDALFATVTNVDFDPDAIAALVAEANRLHKKAKELFEKNNGRAFSGFVPAAAKLWVLPEDRAEQIKLGEEHGVKEGRVSRRHPLAAPDHPLRRQGVCRLRASRARPRQGIGRDLRLHPPDAGEPAQRQARPGR